MAIPNVNTFIYLASQSPRRAQLLGQLGLAHRLLLAGPDEDAEALEEAHPNEAPLAYVKRVTALKLQAAVLRWGQRAAQEKLPPAPILCADTTVALGRSILGKPESAADARRMLRALSGHTHRVLTSVAVAVPKAGSRRGRRAGATTFSLRQATSVSAVRFRALSARDISAYVDSGEPMGKAGAYAIQGGAGAWVAHLSGSYTGIMGLPLFETAQLLGLGAHPQGHPHG
jgi:septum formation protein